MKFKELFKLVEEYHNGGAYHIKRGFKLNETNVLQCLNHLIEETVELQAEACISEDIDKELEEAADVLLVFIHYMIMAKIDPKLLFSISEDKLIKTFSYNKTDILTKTPGFTRGNRNE